MPFRVKKRVWSIDCSKLCIRQLAPQQELLFLTSRIVADFKTKQAKTPTIVCVKKKRRDSQVCSIKKKKRNRFLITTIKDYCGELR